MKIKGLLRECLVGVGCASKVSFLLALNGCLAASLFAQTVVPPPVQLSASPQPSVQGSVTAAATVSPTGGEKLTSEALRQLLAPIALYPDALMALILPASTAPSEVVLASRYLASGEDVTKTDGQTWDQSVKSLLHYPDVLKWMDQNLEWTTNLGAAFVNQPADVMNAIQDLRAQAKAAGNLVNTPQQNVVQEQQIIRIIPAEPEVIYVPVYNPYIVYYQPAVSNGVTFSAGFVTGSWLCYDFDWNRRCFYRGNWQGWNRGGYVYGGGNQVAVVNNNSSVNNTTVNVVNINNATATQWQPSVTSVNRFRSAQTTARLSRVNARAATADVQSGVFASQDMPSTLTLAPNAAVREAQRRQTMQQTARQRTPAATPSVAPSLTGTTETPQNPQQRPSRRAMNHAPLTEPGVAPVVDGSTTAQSAATPMQQRPSRRTTTAEQGTGVSRVPVIQQPTSIPPPSVTSTRQYPTRRVVTPEAGNITTSTQLTPQTAVPVQRAAPVQRQAQQITPVTTSVVPLQTGQGARPSRQNPNP